MFGIAGIIISLHKWTLSSVFVLIGYSRFRHMLIGSVVMVQIGLLCRRSTEIYSLLALATSLYVLKVFTAIDPSVAVKGMCVEIQMAFRNNLCNWL